MCRYFNLSFYQISEDARMRHEGKYSHSLLFICLRCHSPLNNWQCRLWRGTFPLLLKYCSPLKNWYREIFTLYFVYMETRNHLKHGTNSDILNNSPRGFQMWWVTAWFATWTSNEQRGSLYDDLSEVNYQRTAK